MDALIEYHLRLRAEDACEAKLPWAPTRLCCHGCGGRWTGMVYAGYELDGVECLYCGVAGRVEYDEGGGPEMVTH